MKKKNIDTFQIDLENSVDELKISLQTPIITKEVPIADISYNDLKDKPTFRGVTVQGNQDLESFDIYELTNQELEEILKL